MQAIILPVSLTMVLLVLQLGSCSPFRGDGNPNFKVAGILTDDIPPLEASRPKLSIILERRNERKFLRDEVYRTKRQNSDLSDMVIPEEPFFTTITPDEPSTESITTSSSTALPSTPVDSYAPPPSGPSSNGYGPPLLPSPSTGVWATEYPPSYSTPAPSFGPSSTTPVFGYGNSQTKDVDKIYITNNASPNHFTSFNGYFQQSPGYFYHVIGPFYSYHGNPHQSKFRPSYPDSWQNLRELHDNYFVPSYFETWTDHRLWHPHNYLRRDF